MSRRTITQSTLAAALHCSQAAVSRRLAGTVEFNVSELEAIAEILGVEITELLGDPSSERSAS